MSGYRLIQFSADSVHMAPINVGVLVWSLDCAHLKLLGVESDAGFRTKIYRSIAGSQQIADEVLVEWLSWFLELTRNPGKLGEGDHMELDRLIESGCSFSSVNFGRIDCNPDEIALVAEDLFQKCVLNNSRVRHHCLRDQVLQILEETGMAGLPATYWDAELELLPSEGSEAGLLYFPLFFQGDKIKAAVKLIDFSDDPVAVVQQVTDAMNAFELGIARRALVQDECIVIAVGRATDYRQYVKWLASRATLLNVVDRPGVATFFKQLLAKNSL